MVSNQRRADRVVEHNKCLGLPVKVKSSWKGSAAVEPKADRKGVDPKAPSVGVDPKADIPPVPAPEHPEKSKDAIRCRASRCFQRSEVHREEKGKALKECTTRRRPVDPQGENNNGTGSGVDDQLANSDQFVVLEQLKGDQKIFDKKQEIPQKALLTYSRRRRCVDSITQEQQADLSNPDHELPSQSGPSLSVPSASSPLLSLLLP
ncbi:hypothetical protein MRB53_036615 [Persea americana]|nr:hypothetical protein MRB53_042429 [Persea americana]KAJ8611413.1 hypothetical protein MRB53_037995 [Persea americana]KAJ8614375.1 hypothetical protein MRB53_036573 [Persea americana]KAJ8614417.1 hypothetical protein MRB53_036615 [Persea americana]